MKAGNSRDSIEWMHIAKGIGIVLVVIGHFCPETSPSYWVETRRVIYSFHMPLFFFLSGYLYSYEKYSYSDLIKNKIKRLLYPFFSIAALFFVIKYVAGRFVNIDNPVNIDNIYALLADPVNSYMPLLWFVHALFVIFAIYPLARVFLNNVVILVLLLIINSFLGNDYLLFGKALSYMPFFVIGIITRENAKLAKMIINTNWSYVFILLVLFSLGYMSRLSFDILPVYGHVTGIFLGIIGSLFVVNISYNISTLSANSAKNVIQQVGYYSMTIYLFHTLFASAVRIGFFQGLKNIQVPFELVAFVAVASGVIFPLLLEKEVLRKFWITKKMVLGLS
jgi:fucose 4-O-acetylase-like acetyltransferase